jgi:glycylpeptide N-tetradecanoyltransferase
MEDTNKETNNENQENYEQNQDILNSLKQMLFKSGSQKKGEQVKDSYKFWDTQPVPKMNSEDTTEVGPIDTDNDVEKERQEPYKLPTGFSWYDMEIHDDKELTMVILSIILAL